MPSSSNDSGFNFKLSVQISESHCGPAVLQMLLSNLGVEATQEQITAAAAATETITEYGLYIDQMAQAIKNLNLGVTFWYKKHASIGNIWTLLNVYHFPVGVEWQGLFYANETEEEEAEEDSDYGHYSIITHVDRQRKELIIVDPYKDYAAQDRIFGISQFASRWWDTNEIPDPARPGHRLTIRDDQLLFVVTPAGFNFPPELALISTS